MRVVKVACAPKLLTTASYHCNVSLRTMKTLVSLYGPLPKQVLGRLRHTSSAESHVLLEEPPKQPLGQNQQLCDCSGEDWDKKILSIGLLSPTDYTLPVTFRLPNVRYCFGALKSLPKVPQLLLRINVLSF